ncbi:MAG: outer membrane beta-barrel protein [Rikenellaceae bacterium]|nr:outer membrane beta-barrel protein [Rikenellaceae bacterium]
MMSKVLVAALLLVATTNLASAQKLGVDWGVIAGVNAADYSVKAMKNAESFDEVKNDLGWQVGLMTSINVSRLSIEPQIIYVRNKTKFVNDGRSNSVKNNSLDVPILISYRILGPLRVMAGPVFTVMDDNSGWEDISFDQMRSTCSYAVGLEARILQKVRFDVRYNGQFKRKETAVGKVDVSSFAFNVGYYF